MLTTTRKVLLSVSLAVLCANGQANAPAKDRVTRGREFLGLAPPSDPVAAATGQKIFVQSCAFCHGQNATGAEGPDLVRSTVVLHDDNGDSIAAFLVKGRPDRGMPAFASLSSGDLHDIAAFLHSRVEAAANRFSYKLQDIVTGDSAQGKRFFGAHCTGCHSPSGDLSHIAAKFEPADLQTQFLYPSESKTTLSAKVTLPDGTQVKGRLKHLDDFTISLWDETGSYRAWQRNSVKVTIDDPLKGHRELLDVYTNADMHNVLAFLETLK